MLAFNMDTRGPMGSDIWILGSQEPRRAAPLIQQPFNQTQPSLSPDGRWLAYVSNESGANEVMVRPLTIGPSGALIAGSATQVSRGGAETLGSVQK